MSQQKFQGTIIVRSHTSDDLDLLARMNRELIDDEGHRSSMTVEELKERFKRFVSKDGWSIDLFILGEEIIGFATHRYENDEAAEKGESVHLRQFFIMKHFRSGGVGRAALEELLRTRFQSGERIFLNVIEANPGGKIFWSKTGFVPYGTIMETHVLNDGAE